MRARAHACVRGGSLIARAVIQRSGSIGDGGVSPSRSADRSYRTASFPHSTDSPAESRPVPHHTTPARMLLPARSAHTLRPIETNHMNERRTPQRAWLCHCRQCTSVHTDRSAKGRSVGVAFVGLNWPYIGRAHSPTASTLSTAPNDRKPSHGSALQRPPTVDARSGGATAEPRGRVGPYGQPPFRTNRLMLCLKRAQPVRLRSRATLRIACHIRTYARYAYCGRASRDAGRSAERM